MGMLKILFVSALFTYLAYGSFLPTFELEFNEKAINQFISEWKQYHIQAEQGMQKAEHQYNSEVQNIFNKALADLILDYKKIVYPVAKRFSDLINHAEPKKGCNQTCVTDKCFRTDAWSFDWRCVANVCKCYYSSSFETNKHQIPKEIDKVAMTYSEFIQKNYEEVRNAYRIYRKKQMQITQKAIELSEKQLIQIFKCDKTCVLDCNSYYGADFFKYTECIDSCSCEIGFIKITPQQNLL